MTALLASPCAAQPGHDRASNVVDDRRSSWVNCDGLDLMAWSVAHAIRYAPYCGVRVGEALNPGTHGRRPHRDSIRILSQNVTAIRANRVAFDRCTEEVALIQELRILDDEVQTTVSSLAATGWRAVISGGTERQQRVVRGMPGTREHTTGSIRVAKPGATAVAARRPLVAVPEGRPSENAKRLSRSARWSEAYIPVASRGRGPDGIYCASIWGFPGLRADRRRWSDSEDLFSGALEEAARVGHVPYITGVDMNEPIEDSPVLMAALGRRSARSNGDNRIC